MVGVKLTAALGRGLAKLDSPCFHRLSLASCVTSWQKLRYSVSIYLLIRITECPTQNNSDFRATVDVSLERSQSSISVPPFAGRPSNLLEDNSATSNCRIQETDGGFFENLGTLLAERAREQEQAEGPLPKKMDEAQEEEEEEEDLSEEESIEEPVDALLETDSDRDENEHATNFLAESMGWNVS